MRKFFYGFVFIIFVLTFTTCKQFLTDISETFDYWASTVIVKETVIPNSLMDKESYSCIPSDLDKKISLKLINPQNYSLKMPEGTGTYTDIIMFESEVEGTGGGIPVHGTDYELKQINSVALELTYKDEFLKKYEWGLQNLSPTITFYNKEGREFGSHTFKLRSNTPPPDITNITVCKTAASPEKYVLCIGFDPNKLKEKIGSSDLLHKDIKKININNTEYAIKLNSAGDGFDTTNSNFISKTAVVPISSDSDPVPQEKGVLYFKTDIVVGSRQKTYNLYICDEKGLPSSKKTVSTPSNIPDTAKLYDMTGTTQTEITSTATHSLPYTIAYKNIIGGTIQLKAETTTTGAVIKGKIEKYNGSTYIPYADINSGSQSGTDISLPKPESGEVLYKTTFRAEGEGFTPGNFQERYVKLVEGGTLTITSTDLHTNTWKDLKEAVENPVGPTLIIIDGEIKAAKTPGNNGEITVNRTLTIKGKTGSGSDILNANKTEGGKLHHRIFNIESSGNLTLEGLTLKKGGGSVTDKTNGAAVYSKGAFTAKNCKFEDNEAGSNAAGKGGAVNILKGNTIIDNCEFTSNNANMGGAIYVDENGKCTIGNTSTQTTKIHSNTAVNGAGIYVSSTQPDGCRINKGTIIGGDVFNFASSFGGGIFIFAGAECTIKEGVKIQKNQAENGGGIYNDKGNLKIEGLVSDKVIISACEADSSDSDKKKGGGIYIAGGNVTIENADIKGNTVGLSGEGQAFYVAGGTFEMKTGAKIDDDNDVYLKANVTIQVNTNDISDFGAKITPEKYPNKNNAIKVLEGSAIQASHNKFKVSDKANHTHWKVDDRGNLAQLVKSSDSWKILKQAVTDAHNDAFIYIDGEIKATNAGDNHGFIEIKKDPGFSALDTKVLTIIGVSGSGNDILNANYGTDSAYNTNEHQIFKVFAGVEFTLKGLTLKGAASTTDGGAIYTQGTVNMIDCVIKDNKTYYSRPGAGVFIAAGTFIMDGGLITGNTQSSGVGKGVYVANGLFTMKGSAKVDENNDVYLPTNKTINISGELTPAGGTAALINPQSYPSGNTIKVLEGDISIDKNYKKFKVKSNGITLWYVGSDGNLTTDQP